VQIVDGLMGSVYVVKDGKSVCILGGGIAVFCAEQLIELEVFFGTVSVRDQEAGNSCKSQMGSCLGMKRNQAN